MNKGRSEGEYIYIIYQITNLFSVVLLGQMKGLDFSWRRGIRNTLVNKV